jgi:hypothetical protein
VELGGWSAAGAVCALTLGAVYGGLAHGLLRDGRSPVASLLVPIVAAGVGSIHFLVRPHLVTLAFVLVTLRVCQAQHERGGRRLLWLPLLMVPWANCHGGFLAGPLIVVTAGLGHAVSGRWDRERRRCVGFFGVCAALCSVAALINPYGVGLYVHVGRLLISSGVTSLIEEYQPIPFGRPDARAVELVVLALVGLPTIAATRMSRYELVQTLVWMHLSLASVRHAPLFALAVAPGLARLIDGLPGLRPKEPIDPEMLRPSVWPWAAAAVLAVATIFGARLTGFDPAHWPVAALPAVERLAPEAKLFHEQDWGGLLSSRRAPARRTFLDDRFELFGKTEILSYLNAIEGGPDWDELAARHSIRAAWVRPDRGLARRLSADPRWRESFRDGVSVLFERSDLLSARSGR